MVTYAYGAEGKHGANYMQTMAASVASLSGMAVLIQAMTWLGFPEPPVWQLVLYFLCIGMFGVGVGMLYTPILVDRMRLSFPSGFAVANILRALTDIRILKTSITKLGGGTLAGFAGGIAATYVPRIARDRVLLLDPGGGHDRRGADRRPGALRRRDRSWPHPLAARDRHGSAPTIRSARSASSWRSG